MRLLVVKTSSLGDVIHTLPAVTDAARLFPDLHCDWLVERAFAEIPVWHSAVERVIACDLRSWRKQPGKALLGGEWSRFRNEIRSKNYDLVLDAQGLLKSAFLAGQAIGPIAGPDRRAAREPLATTFYSRRLAIPRREEAHAVERNRSLFAAALGYQVPETPADAGLSRACFPQPDLSDPYVMLLHGTTWTSKRWPLANWQSVARTLTSRGMRVVLPWGNAVERDQAYAIASAANGLVLPALGLTPLAGWLAHARAAVGIDTGLAHLAAALGTPQVTLYGPTLPQRTGAVGANQVWLRSDDHATTVDRQRPTTVSVERTLEAVSEVYSAGEDCATAP